MPTESEIDYITKVKNEYLVGEFLEQQNLIRTLELIKEDLGLGYPPEFFIVMEYCPYDFFNLVMSGLMSKDEVCCYTKQIINGVSYLHKSGISHRDLKLDNCVVTEEGILKLIDFGSAFQFSKPLSYNSGPNAETVLLDELHKLVLARGIVGSDPYLSPEVFSSATTGGYDPRLADVWSIAIIFCCMILKRFPWKLPMDTDPSFKAFRGLTTPSLEKDFKNLDVNSLEVPPKEGTSSSSSKSGPHRLLRLLPSVSRAAIAGMLEIDTSKRFFIDQVIDSEFYASIDHCHYVEDEGESILKACSLEEPGVSFVKTNLEDDPQNGKDEKDPNEEEQEDQENGSHDDIEKGQIEKDQKDQENGKHDEIDSSTGIQNVQPKETSVENRVTQETKTSQLPKEKELRKGANHIHHLLTEKDLEKLNAEREQEKKVKEAGLG